MREQFDPTEQQQAIFQWTNSAFVAACPGAGKTRVMVERARQIAGDKADRRGVAFLSFTTAAVSELTIRLEADRILPSPPFPHFVGTFDSFLWQFFLAPFGVPGLAIEPQLYPDKDNLKIWDRFPLGIFDPVTFEADPAECKKRGFDVTKDYRATRRLEAEARNRHERLFAKGLLGFNDVRTIVSQRLKDISFRARLGSALASRFREVIVDEAQDCNPADLEIVAWLRQSGLMVKVICDPNQAIFGFRGGVTDELTTFSSTFGADQLLPMTGNFRSSQIICDAASVFRLPSIGRKADNAIGKHRAAAIPVYVLEYPGIIPPPTIGQKFRELVAQHQLQVASAPILASRWDDANVAAGLPKIVKSTELVLRLARAVSAFFADSGTAIRLRSLEDLHRIMLEIGGWDPEEAPYRKYLSERGITAHDWRPEAIKIMRALRYDPANHSTLDAWHSAATSALGPLVLPGGGKSIGQLVRKVKGLDAILGKADCHGSEAFSVHAVKGREFPAACVVVDVQKCGRILEHCKNGGRTEMGEDTRKLFVGVTRAEQLLAIAVPHLQSTALQDLLKSAGVVYESISLVPAKPKKSRSKSSVAAS